MKMNIKQKLRYAAALALGTVFMAAGSFHAWASQTGANPAAANTWVPDAQGILCHLDGNGQIQYNAWIDEGGRWRYVDGQGHMVVSMTKTVGGVQYTFDGEGYMVAGSERPAWEYEIGSLSGQTYENRWADIRLTFPDTAEVRLGDGSARTYPVIGGEHVEENDPELGYRFTVDFLDTAMSLAQYHEKLIQDAAAKGYQVNDSGTAVIGGYEYLTCRASFGFSDGTSHFSEVYVRQIDDKLVELRFDYYEELKDRADFVLTGISKAG